MLSVCGSRLGRSSSLMHQCRRSLQTASSSMAPAAAAAAAPSAASVAAEPISVISFPKTASYLEGKARDAARARLAAAPRPPRRQPVALPRNMQLQPRAPLLADTPVRTRAGRAIAVPWKISRDASGLLPLHLIKPVVHENSKHVLEVTGVSGDVDSFARELQLLVGPLYYVTVNSVQSRVTVQSSPKSKVDDKCVDKIRQWLIRIGA